jgi:hypothetical protein
MTTLTDRYAWAVVRLLPEDQRPEIEREVRSLVADLIDGRRGDDDLQTDPRAHEREVLAELGDPGLLAARYVERPRALIGPDHFPEYARILKLVVAVAVPVVTALSALGAALGEDADLLSILVAALVGAVNSTIQAGFWVTAVYAFADRWKRSDPWSPDALPDLPDGVRGPGVGELVAGIVFTVLAGVALIWQEVRPPVTDGAGNGVPVLHPDLWGGSGQLLFALLLVSVAIQLLVLRGRRWTAGLAVVNAGTNTAFLAAVTWAALEEKLVNTRFLEVLAERGHLDQVPTVNPWIPIVAVAIIVAWDSAEAFIAVHRQERRSTVPS